MADLALRVGMSGRVWMSTLAMACATFATSCVANAAAPKLRVCADPNNMPFSRADEAGFENRLALLIGSHVGRQIEFEWRAQRRGFLRQGLNAGECDLVAGVPTQTDSILTTRPYYRSSYVFVTRPGDPSVASFDDPALKQLRIGVQLVGDDGMNTPPAHELARRGVIDNVRGYSVYGDYAKPAPPSAILDAVARSEIDVAAVWGPLAGYFADKMSPKLALTPITTTGVRLPMSFDISMGVRKGDVELADAVQKALDEEKASVDRLLVDFHVPWIQRSDAPEPSAQR